MISLSSFIPLSPHLSPFLLRMDGIRLQEVMFNGFWGWWIFQRPLLPGRLMCHRFQEVPGAQSYLTCLTLQAHLDLHHLHHAHLWHIQLLQEDLWTVYRE